MHNFKKYTTNIRVLCASMVERANSGHPGSCMGLAPLLLQVYDRLYYDPDCPRNPDRDVFIMSNAHACAIQYVFNALIGYLKVEDLKEFRQLNSRTPGHPEKNDFGIEITSEPLGQGVAEAVGFAIAMKKMKSPNRVICVFGDGCYQEGISQEAFSLAANLCLNNLIYIYDYNKMTIDGSTEISMCENVVGRFVALGFEVVEILDEKLLEDCVFMDKIFSIKEKPTMVIFHSVIGAGCRKAGRNEMHGTPIGREEIDLLKKEIDLGGDFEICEGLKEFFAKRNEELRKKRHVSEISFNIEYPTLDIDECVGETSPMATRVHLKKTIEKLALKNGIVLGSADLGDSVGVKRKDAVIFDRNNYNGDYINFGIREHAMCAAMNGMCAFGMVAIGGTFLNFVTYCFPAIRLAALDGARAIYVLSHDSIGLGEDGPTHQPIEALSLLRATPNLHVLRPCDGTEVAFSLKYAIERMGPTCIVVSRQSVEQVPNSSISGASKGAYFIKFEENSTVTIIATGSEVALCLKVLEKLFEHGVTASLVSMISFEIFDSQPISYRKQILRGFVVSVEMLAKFGWSAYSKLQIGMDTFGKSGKAKDLLEYFGFTVEKIVEKILMDLKNEE